MSLSKSKCQYSNNCLQYIKCAVPLSIMAVEGFITLAPEVDPHEESHGEKSTQ
jgi:hypothetical protein